MKKNLSHTKHLAAVVAAGVLLAISGGCSTVKTLPTLNRPGGCEEPRPGGGSSDITWPPTGR